MVKVKTPKPDDKDKSLDDQRESADALTELALGNWRPGSRGNLFSRPPVTVARAPATVGLRLVSNKKTLKYLLYYSGLLTVKPLGGLKRFLCTQGLLQAYATREAE